MDTLSDLEIDFLVRLIEDNDWWEWCTPTFDEVDAKKFIERLKAMQLI